MSNDASSSQRSATPSTLEPAHYVNVTFQDGELVVTPAQLSIPSGATAIWRFHNLPADWVPSLVFQQAGRQGLGPFVAIRHLATQVWGQGSDGSGATYSYQAAINHPDDPGVRPILSDPMQLRIDGDAHSGPTVQVRVDMDSGVFDVEPDSLTRFNDQTVTFHFEGLHDDDVASIHFHVEELKSSEEPAASSHWGPFEAFRQEENQILAEGSNGTRGSFSYTVDVARMIDGRRQEKRLACSDDPFIYSEEDPVDPGEPVID